jgi:AcrR family transcriptional regulator
MGVTRAATVTTASGNGAGQATRERIMNVAERLFARRGIDRVSIRDITTAAKVNTAAIHYHFGSKQGLIVAILDRSQAELNRRRAELLDQVEASDTPTLRDVIEALVIPSAQLVADTRGPSRYYIGFISEVAAHPQFMPLVIQATERYSHRFHAALKRVTPHLSDDVRELRFAIAKDMVNRVLGQSATGPVRGWLDQRAPHAVDNLAERLIDFLVGGFAAPAEW